MIVSNHRKPRAQPGRPPAISILQRYSQASLVLKLLLLPVCAHAEALIRDDIIRAPLPGSFSICQDYSCATLSTQSITRQQWQQASGPMREAAGSAEQERAGIARYIANMEKLLGPQTGTSQDVGGTFPGALETGQMDCIDEANNTSTYLRMLQMEKLLRFHRPTEMAHRGFFLFGWPHTSATMEEIPSGARYAVDSWFHGNGEPPEIVPLQHWKSGWSPSQE